MGSVGNGDAPLNVGNFDGLLVRVVCVVCFSFLSPRMREARSFEFVAGTLGRERDLHVATTTHFLWCRCFGLIAFVVERDLLIATSPANGHVGFMLTSYDAEHNYERQTDSFKARYPPHGPRTIVVKEGVRWERLCTLPLDTPVHDLHASDCLADLQPGDHVEVQWCMNKEFSYGGGMVWWDIPRFMMAILAIAAVIPLRWCDWSSINTRVAHAGNGQPSTENLT